MAVDEELGELDVNGVAVGERSHRGEKERERYAREAVLLVILMKKYWFISYI